MSTTLFARTLIALSFLVPLQASDLTGHWLSTSHAPDGQIRESSLFLNVQGDQVSGYVVLNNQDAAPMVDAKLSGNELSFMTVRDYYGEERKTNFTATVQADTGITLHMPGYNGVVRNLVFGRVSKQAPGPMPPPKPKLMLPPTAEVPPNGLAKSPPMGWNSWNKFAGKVSDQLVRETADAMASNGMKAAGYEYVNIDDTWQAGRDAQGNIQPNEKFPDMKALADYIHSKGLKLGIYSSPGPKTCAGYEGSFQHEEQDAKTYAGWNIDYLKYDWCSAERVYDYHAMQAAYAKMGKALLDSGRPIVYSLCQYGLLNSSSWGPKVGGNLWRTTGDIRDSWDSMAKIGFDQQLPLTKYAEPGHWNDPDMLEVGNGGMTDVEYRTHMSLWSLLAAPLLAGNDLRSAPASTLALLTNREVIAIDQDKLGKEAMRVSKNGATEVWVRPLADGAYAVGLFNRGAESSRVTAAFGDLGINGKAHVRDLWKHSDVGDSDSSFSAEVPSHGVVLVKIVPAA